MILGSEYKLFKASITEHSVLIQLISNSARAQGSFFREQGPGILGIPIGLRRNLGS